MVSTILPFLSSESDGASLRAPVVNYTHTHPVPSLAKHVTSGKRNEKKEKTRKEANQDENKGKEMK